MIVDEVKVHFLDEIEDDLDLSYEELEIEDDWDIGDISTLMRNRGGIWDFALTKKYHLGFTLNQKMAFLWNSIEDGDVVSIYPQSENFKEGPDDDPELSDYIMRSEINDLSDPVFPERVLPRYSKDKPSEAPDGWKHVLYPSLYLKHLASVDPNKSFSYAHLAGKTESESLLFTIEPSYFDAWTKLNNDLVGALRDGEQYLKINHGDKEPLLKHIIRNWLMGCGWVLAYCEPGAKSNVVNVELKLPNSPV